MRVAGVWCVLLFSPSVASADVGGYVELVGGKVYPQSGETSSPDSDYPDLVGPSWKLGLRGGPSFRAGHVRFGVELGVDHTWYRERDDDEAMWRNRAMLGGRVTLVDDDSTRARVFARLAGGIDRVTFVLPEILEDLCFSSTTDTGAAYEVGIGAGIPLGRRVILEAQVDYAVGDHRDHRPVCAPDGDFPGATIDVLDYRSVDIDLLGGVAVEL